MIIKDLSNTQTVEFWELENGDVFKYNDILFLKIDSAASTSNAYSFENKRKNTFERILKVEYITSELILHSPGWTEEQEDSE